MSKKSFFLSFHYPNYRLFFGSQLISLIGTWMQSTALSYLAFTLSGSGKGLGTVILLMQLPCVLTGFVGGAIADKYDRHKMFIFTQTIFLSIVIILALLVLFNLVTMPLLYIIATCCGLLTGIDSPVRQAFVSDLVPKESLANAIALNASVYNTARVVGPAIGAIVVGLVGVEWCFILNIICITIALTQLFRMKSDNFFLSKIAKVKISTVQVLGYARGTPLVYALLALCSVICFTLASLISSLLIFAEKIFINDPAITTFINFLVSVSPSAKPVAFLFGMLSAFLGAGSLIAAIMLANKESAKHLDRSVSRAALIAAVALFLFTNTESFFLALAVVPVIGFGLVVCSAGINTMLQLGSPAELRGRIVAMFVMVFLGSSALGALATGAGADAFGVVRTYEVCSLLLFVFAVFFAIFRRRLGWCKMKVGSNSCDYSED